MVCVSALDNSDGYTGWFTEITIDRGVKYFENCARDFLIF